MSPDHRNAQPNEEQCYKISMIAPTCYYWQVALYQKLAAHPRVNLKVYFCSDEALHAIDAHKMYKTDQKWGEEDLLLEGYDYKFLKNYSPSPTYLTSPFGLLNLGVWNEIRKEKPDVVVLMAWSNPTWWLAFLACRRFRIPYFLMTDANIQNELGKPKWKLRFKKLLLGKLLFRLSSGFLYAGRANMRLYRFYGVPEEKLVPFAYSGGYETLLHASSELIAQRDQIRAELGIPKESYLILFCGRLSQEKNIVDLLDAYQQIASCDKALVIVGDGELRQSLQDYVAKHHLESVYFVGFQNRKALPKFYAASDVLVLPSKWETWGIVVSEAMCFGLPIIVSNEVGAGSDLVIHGQNGFHFPCGDVEALARAIRTLTEQSDDERLEMGKKSLEFMQKWAARDLAENFVQHLDRVYGAKGRRSR